MGGTIKIGRPLKFQDIDKFNQQIEDYFQKCDDEDRPYTVTGLALALDTDRRTLLEYQDGKKVNLEGKEEFSNSIKRAKARIENWLTEYMIKTNKPVGVIFTLKNCHGWRDQKEVQHDIGKEAAALVERLNKALTKDKK